MLIGNARLFLSGVRFPTAVSEAVGVPSSSLAEVSLPTSPPRARSDPSVRVCRCCVWARRVGSSSFSLTRRACETWPGRGGSPGLSAGRPSWSFSIAGGANSSPSEGASEHPSSVLLVGLSGLSALCACSLQKGRVPEVRDPVGHAWKLELCFPALNFWTELTVKIVFNSLFSFYCCLPASANTVSLYRRNSKPFLPLSGAASLAFYLQVTTSLPDLGSWALVAPCCRDFGVVLPARLAAPRNCSSGFCCSPAVLCPVLLCEWRRASLRW